MFSFTLMAWLFTLMPAICQFKTLSHQYVSERSSFDKNISSRAENISSLVSKILKGNKALKVLYPLCALSIKNPYSLTALKKSATLIALSQNLALKGIKILKLDLQMKGQVEFIAPKRERRQSACRLEGPLKWSKSQILIYSHKLGGFVLNNHKEELSWQYYNPKIRHL